MQVIINCCNNNEFNKDWESNIMVIDERYGGEKLELQIKIISFFKKRRGNKIAISYGTGIEYFIVNSITTQIQEFIDSIYRKGYNLGSLTFFIDSNERWKKEYHPEIKFDSTGWLLENIVSDKNNYEIENTKPTSN